MSEDEKSKSGHTKPERRAYSVEETAEITDLSRSTIYRLIATGKLTTLKVGARRIVPSPSIDALLDAAKADASSAVEQRGSISKVPPQPAARLTHAEVSAK